ncbi:hypothetical protein RRG08_044289 [Elysia crispata]|uniref:Uncharacterized protein n=1 Tax=Elysia crispata TaxID=231223 RepID=A0AAE1CNS1_9GAST|nr:hypothetical protein RRG08_044289 [Elysia crispata]
MTIDRFVANDYIQQSDILETQAPKLPSQPASEPATEAGTEDEAKESSTLADEPNSSSGARSILAAGPPSRTSV